MRIMKNSAYGPWTNVFRMEPSHYGGQRSSWSPGGEVKVYNFYEDNDFNINKKQEKEGL